MKKIIFPMFFILLSFPLLATPDPERNITDVLLGYSNDELIIYQTVFDNNGSHYSTEYERYILVKKVENHQLVLIKKIKIETDSEITKYISQSDFRYAIPDIVESKYFHLDEQNKDHLYYYGVYYHLKEILPRELWVYNIDKIDYVYDLTDRVFVVINLISENRIESLKKVILLFERDK